MGQGGAIGKRQGARRKIRTKLLQYSPKAKQIWAWLRLYRRGDQTPTQFYLVVCLLPFSFFNTRYFFTQNPSPLWVDMANWFSVLKTPRNTEFLPCQRDDKHPPHFSLRVSPRLLACEPQTYFRSSLLSLRKNVFRRVKLQTGSGYRIMGHMKKQSVSLGNLRLVIQSPVTRVCFDLTSAGANLLCVKAILNYAVWRNTLRMGQFMYENRISAVQRSFLCRQTRGRIVLTT